jgi:predicted Zn-dependent peptidase
MAHHAIKELGFNFKDELIEKVKNVTSEEVQNVARKYLNDISVVSILRP